MPESDELAEISGVKPKVLLADGEEREVSSMSRCVVMFSLMFVKRSDLGFQQFCV